MSGACSRIACTFVPDNPYDDTAARRGVVPVVGQGAVCSGTTSPDWIRARSSGSRVKCSIGGIAPCRSERIALVNATAPAAESAWPALLLTDPAPLLACGAVHLRQARELDRVTARGAGAIRLDQAYRVGVHPRRGQCRPVHRDPGVRRVFRWRRKTRTAAVLIGGGAAQNGKDAVAIVQRVRESLEQHHGAALGTHVPVGADIERPAASRRRQHAPARHRRECARFQHHRAAAGQGEIAFAVVQTAASHVDREQARRACRVHGQRRAAQPQGVGDPSGSKAGGRAGEAVLLPEGACVGGEECVVGVGQSDEHAPCEPVKDVGARPACSTASHDTSSSKRCCGSSAAASRSPIPKNSGSKPATSSRKPPHRDTDRSGTPGSGS